MPSSFSRAARIAVGLAVILIAGPVFAVEVTVLTAGAFKPVLLDLIPAFERATGHTVTVDNDTAGGVSARIARGEAFDLVVVPTAALATLAGSGKVVAGTSVPLAKAGIGVAVKAGAPKPDISTVEAFKNTLLTAPSIAYIDPAAGGSSGIYLAQLFDRLGIAEALRKKSVLVPGGLTASRVVNGEAALALQQISELRAVADVTFVGSLPAEIQNYTVYAGGIPATAARPDAGKALLAHLHGGAAAAVLVAKGLEKP